MTTSPSFSGLRPSATDQPFSSGSSTQASARAGGPLPGWPSALPDEVTIRPEPWMNGFASFTPSTWLTVSSSDASMASSCVNGPGPASISSLFVERTNASVPLLPFENKSSNVWFTVAVRIDTPEKKPMPMTTARKVPTSRRLWATRLRSVTFSTTSVSECLQAIEHLVGGGFGHRVDDATVLQEQRPIGVTRGDGIVRDHHDRLAEVADRPPHEREDLGARARVEVPRGLVGEDDLRLCREGAGHCHALLLAPRQLRRTMLEAIAQPDG